MEGEGRVSGGNREWNSRLHRRGWIVPSELVSKNLPENLVPPPRGFEKNTESKGQEKNCDASNSNLYDCSTKDNRVHRDYKRSSESRDRGLDNEERCGKRSCTHGWKNDRQYCSRGQHYPSDRVRCFA
ncbi:hypothetical protein V6N13_004882 [Hibiscus sabdariffa]